MANPESRWRSRPGKWPGWTTSSPRSGRGPEWRQGVGRRRASAAAGGGDRGGSVKDSEGAELATTSERERFTGV
jgi:hypothetical protein